jgi:hypothetical protein
MPLPTSRTRWAAPRPSLAELRRRLAAADVELVDRRQIVDGEMVGVLAGGAKPLENRARAIEAAVVRRDLLLERHLGSPAVRDQRPLNSGAVLARNA